MVLPQVRFFVLLSFGVYLACCLFPPQAHFFLLIFFFFSFSPEQVVLTESRFVLPHALYLTAHLSYRLRPTEEQLFLSYDLCVRAKRIKDYDFDCQVKIGNLMTSLRHYINSVEAAAK